MKKLFTVCILALGSVAAFAQQDIKQIVPSDFEDITEISKTQHNGFSTSFDLVAPIRFGLNTLTDITYLEDWALTESLACPGFLNTNMGKSFFWSVDLCTYTVTAGKFSLGASLRYTSLDFAFANTGYAFMVVDSELLPKYIHDTDYTGKKSKYYANYIGVPIMARVKVGQLSVYAGYTADFFLDASGMYKKPRVEYSIDSGFNKYRGSVECGVSYDGIGIFMNTSLTPVFDNTQSGARTLSIGIVLGL